MLVSSLASYPDTLTTTRRVVGVVYTHIGAVGGRYQSCILRSAAVNVLDETVGWIRGLFLSVYLLQRNGKSR